MLQDTELLCMVRDLFLAGTDTIASSTAWLILCYLHHPEHHHKILEEIDEALGKKNRKIVRFH